MRDDTLADKIWSGIMIALPALAMILSVIPMYPMVGDKGYELCSLLNPPARNILTNICPMVTIVYAYTLILTICYFRSQALGTMKAIFIFSVVSLCVAGLALLPDNIMKPWPFMWHVFILGAMCVVSLIRMLLEIKRCDFD